MQNVQVLFMDLISNFHIVKAKLFKHMSVFLNEVQQKDLLILKKLVRMMYKEIDMEECLYLLKKIQF